MVERVPLRHEIPPALSSKPVERVEIHNVKLSAREHRFVVEYLRDFNPARAALRAGYAPNSVQLMSAALLRKPSVMTVIHAEIAMHRERVGASIEEVAEYWYELATADARELNPVRRRCCRYCWGLDNQYQFTAEEHRQLARKHRIAFRNSKHEPPPLDDQGGAGFDRIREPNPECPECRGLGQMVVESLDLSEISYGASLLFNGIKILADGSIEVKMRDRSRAMENFQTVMGFVRPRRGVLDFNFADVTDDQLDAVLQEAQARGLLTPRDFAPSIDGEAKDVTPPRGKRELVA